MRVVLERGGAEQQHVPAQRGDGRDRPPRRLAGMPGRTAQVLGFVHHQQVDAGPHRLIGQPRPRDQRLERNHGAAVGVEGVEALAEVAGHVGQARRVEEGEHLVVLAPQLAEPLHGQRVGRHDQAALDPPGVHQAVQDQAASTVLPSPTSSASSQRTGIRRAGALRDVQLVGEQPDAAAEKRAQAVGLAQREQVEGVEPDQEIVDAVHVAERQAIEKRALELDRPQRVSRYGLTVGQPHRAVAEARHDGGFLVCRHEPDGPAWAEIHRPQRLGVGRQPQRGVGAGEHHHHRAPVERDDAADAELGVEAVGEEIAWGPDAPRRHFKTARR